MSHFWSFSFSEPPTDNLMAHTGMENGQSTKVSAISVKSWTQIISLPLDNLEPDLLFGMSDQAIFWCDVLPWYQQELEPLDGGYQHNGRFHIGKAVGWALTFASKAIRGEGNGRSAFASLLRETIRVKPTRNKNNIIPWYMKQGHTHYMIHIHLFHVMCNFHLTHVNLR